MIITFSGHNGSGKTVVSKMLAKELGYDWWGMAQITRAHAEELGISILEHDKLLIEDPEMDRDLDRFQTDLGSKEDMVIDSRAGWHFIPHSKKIFLTADEDIRAQRAFDAQRDSEKYESVEQAKEQLHERIETVRSRLRNIYGIDVYDPANFDLVIDTSHKTFDEILSEIREFLQL